MSNHGDPWRKFVQTFFLAEQPNGYFVLNDIFRFLKEETVEGDDASEVSDTEPVPTAPSPEPVSPAVPVHTTETAYEPPREPTPPPAMVAAPTPAVAAPPPAPVEEAPTTDIPEPPAQTPTPAPEPQSPPTVTAAPQTNGIHTPEPENVVPVAPVEKSPAPAPAPQLAPSPAPPAPAAAVPTPPPAVQAPAAPAPTTPSAPRSWASLAASNHKKWGSAVAQESRGTTETPAGPAPASGTQTPSSTPAPAAPVRVPQHHHQPGGQGHHSGGREHPALIAAQNVSTPQCFVKVRSPFPCLLPCSPFLQQGVTEPVSQTALIAFLTQRFGPIKDLEIVRAKACAFLEFSNLDSAKRAITASLSQNQGGEGGVWIDVGGEVGQVRISVETRKERGERPIGRPRGGAPVVNGENRGGGGGFRGRGAGRGGRGGSAPVPKQA